MEKKISDLIPCDMFLQTALPYFLSNLASEISFEPYYRYIKISKNKYVIFFQADLEQEKNMTYPKILLCCILSKLRRTVKIHYISAPGVCFSNQYGLLIKLWAGGHNSYIWPKTVSLSFSMVQAKSLRKHAYSNILKISPPKN